MMDLTSVHEHSLPCEIIRFCINAVVENVIAGDSWSNKVVRISELAVVKFGIGVSHTEARNQQLARQLLDSTIVRIPQVYQFFKDIRSRGYIVMEHVAGRSIDPLDDPYLIQKIATVLDDFATVRGHRPGPLGGGFSQGLLFSEEGDISFDTVSALEDWCNSRLVPCDRPLAFRESELILCHLDIAPRNILWHDDGSMFLIDWASAGFYPRFFEICSQWIIGCSDGLFSDVLVGSIQGVKEHEIIQGKRLLKVWRNTQQYSFQSRKRTQALSSSYAFPPKEASGKLADKILV